MSGLGGVALLAALAWAWLLWMRGGFWRADQRLNDDAPDRLAWPAVVAVIPARDEAEGVGRAVASLLAQDYAGDFRIVLVDDDSEDDTADVARAAARGSDRLTVLSGQPLPPGWTGKLWAVSQGLEEVSRRQPGPHPDARYVLLTDADIEHAPSALRRLVDKAEWDGLDLVSLMVRLRCRSRWERLLVPAFVFFFQKLYPFPWVNDADRPEAAAAGGCMLVRRDALERMGGIQAIRDQVIDDCALARAIKADGSIWLGLAEDTQSLRAYDRLGDVWNMVARTAFVQLNHSVVLLLGTVLGMVALYLIPPVATLGGGMAGDWPAFLAGGVAWTLLGRAYAPTLRLYGRPAWEATLLPLAGLLYTLMTVDSAVRHWAGRGSGWKGRNYGRSASGSG